MKRLVIIALGVLAVSMSVRAELPDVTEEAVAELGATSGTPQMNGFVFIDGRYIPPPYTVTRKGNGIFINRIQIEQPAPWPRVAAEPAAGGAVAPAKKAVDADGDFEEVGDAAEKPRPAPQAVDATAAEPEPEPGAADPAKPKVVKSIDDLFDDAPAKPVAAAEAVTPPAPVAVALSPEEVKRQKAALVANLERLRKGYDQALVQNEVFFFGQHHNRVNGNYGTARTLMGVLPKALRNAQSPQDLMQRLNEGGVYFLDQSLCSALFKYKSAFPVLEERLKKILEAEELDAMKRKPTAQW